jgi:hypothetical protein
MEVEVFNDWSEDNKGPEFKGYTQAEIVKERIIGI